MSGMWFFRYLAIGLLAGATAVPLLHNPRGEGFEQLRLAAIMSLEAGQFLAVPVALLIGSIKAGFWNSRPRSAPSGGFVLGGITLAFGALVLTQAMAASRWLNGLPSGVGDPDGEYALAGLAVLSGAVTMLVGILILIDRGLTVWCPPEAGRPGSF